MRKQRTGNRNFDYNTYDAQPEDIISLIPSDAGAYAHPEDFKESAALSILQNRRDVLFAKSIMENTGGLAFMASRLSEAAPLGREAYESILSLYVKKSLKQMMDEVAKMDEYTFVTTLVFVILLVLVLLLVLATTASFYPEKLAKLQKKNSISAS